MNKRMSSDRRAGSRLLLELAGSGGPAARGPPSVTGARRWKLHKSLMTVIVPQTPLLGNIQSPANNPLFYGGSEGSCLFANYGCETCLDPLTNYMFLCTND